jgi:hypothetical protein
VSIHARQYYPRILTKENLLKRNGNGNTSCCLCDKEETIQHLFFGCPLAKIIWRIVHMMFGLSPPKNVKNLFGNWLAGIDKRDVKQIRVWVCAIIWAIWNAWNDKVLTRTRVPSLLQVIPVATHWIRTWSYLQPVEFREVITIAFNRLETVTRDLFSQFGWRRNNRITTC